MCSVSRFRSIFSMSALPAMALSAMPGLEYIHLCSSAFAFLLDCFVKSKIYFCAPIFDHIPMLTIFWGVEFCRRLEFFKRIENIFPTRTKTTTLHSSHTNVFTFLTFGPCEKKSAIHLYIYAKCIAHCFGYFVFL